MIGNDDPVDALLRGALCILDAENAFQNKAAGPAPAQFPNVIPGQIGREIQFVSHRRLTDFVRNASG